MKPAKRPADWFPNWRRILQSEVWQEEILPWLEDMEATEREAFVSVPDVPALRYLQGRLSLLKDLRETPQGMIEADRLEKEREAEEDARRCGGGRKGIASLTAIT